MRSLLPLLITLLFSFTLYSQDTKPDEVVLPQDSILLRNFWTNFIDAIEKNDKDKLATLCEFPFNCRPCIDDTTLKHNNHTSIKVTKKLLFESQYKRFFEGPIGSEIEEFRTFEPAIFFPAYNDKGIRDGYFFIYTIVPPSANWEGLEGFVYLAKRNGKFKITGVDTVP